MPLDNPTDVAVTLRDVSQRFGRRTVFSGICGRVGTGQTLVVAGPNGSGKSTLLRVAAGLLAPSSGEIWVTADGVSLGPMERRPFIGYVAPDLRLYAELSGAENLLFFGRLRGLSLTRPDLVALLERVGLKGRGRDLVANYSSGMRQRLKYAFALLHRPPILILDEPTANLDASGVQMVESLVDEQKRNGLVVVGTNEVREVGWGDTVVRLGA